MKLNIFRRIQKHATNNHKTIIRIIVVLIFSLLTSNVQPTEMITNALNKGVLIQFLIFYFFSLSYIITIDYSTFGLQEYVNAFIATMFFMLVTQKGQDFIANLFTISKF